MPTRVARSNAELKEAEGGQLLSVPQLVCGKVLLANSFLNQPDL
jgi:hypothetical protein